MTRPHWIYHFTRVEHLLSILQHGLLSDTLVAQHLQIEVGNVEIKSQRSRRRVLVTPGGVVSDYVPFYYAPRSPMMYAIDRGNVPTYADGCDRLIYLITSVERLLDAGLVAVGTDRNAVLALASFHVGQADILGCVDWPLMSAKYWSNTQEDPDRRERRQAECLLHEAVPWPLIQAVAAKTERVAQEVRAALATIRDTSTRVVVRPDLYF